MANQAPSGLKFQQSVSAKISHLISIIFFPSKLLLKETLKLIVTEKTSR